MRDGESRTSRVVRALTYWLIVATAVTCLSLMVYGAGQQILRQSANDPQIALAEDAAATLMQGAKPDSVVNSQQIDIAHSLLPFLIVFDAGGKPVASSAVLDGGVPSVPAGVFDYTAKHDQDRITWQPVSDARIAAVIQHYGGAAPGFVLAGRSLREVERREDSLLAMVALGWLVTLALTLIVALTLAVVIELVLRNRRA
jgi:hypothetical protein